MRRRILGLAAIAVSLAFGAAPAAQAQARDTVIDPIKAKKAISIGYRAASIPFSYIDAQGKSTGYRAARLPSCRPDASIVLMTDRTPSILPAVALAGTDAGRDGEPAAATAGDAPERDTRPARPATGMWEHLCHQPDCGLWGPWGFQRGKGEQRWYCSTHRVEGERFLGRRAPDANGRAHGAGAETYFDGETR